VHATRSCSAGSAPLPCVSRRLWIHCSPAPRAASAAPSTSLSVRPLSVSSMDAAAACGGFAAECPARPHARYIDRQQVRADAHSKCGQCRVRQQTDEAGHRLVAVVIISVNGRSNLTKGRIGSLNRSPGGSLVVGSSGRRVRSPRDLSRSTHRLGAADAVCRVQLKLNSTTRTRPDPHGPNGVSPQQKSARVRSGPCSGI